MQYTSREIGRYRNHSILQELADPDVASKSDESAENQKGRSARPWYRSVQQLLLNHNLALHFSVAETADHRTLKGKGSGFVGSELDSGGLPLAEPLIHVKFLYFNSVIAVCRRYHQFYVLALFHHDRVGLEFIFFGRHFDFMNAGRGLCVFGSVLRGCMKVKKYQCAECEECRNNCLLFHCFSNLIFEIFSQKNSQDKSYYAWATKMASKTQWLRKKAAIIRRFQS